MSAKAELIPVRSSLSTAQRALFEQRLQRARQATAEPGAIRPSIPRRTPAGPAPLSFAQERLWFLDQLEPGSAVYNLCQALRISGPLQRGALEQALNDIVQRHEALRTNFVAVDGRPVQLVAPERRLTVAFEDLSTRDPATAEAEALRRLDEEARRPFDLAKDVLVRGLLIRIGGAEYRLLLTMHHIVSDGWSVGVLFRELAEGYAASVAGSTPEWPELPVQYADYAAWEREQMHGAAFEKSLAYWRRQLGGDLPELALPFDRRCPPDGVVSRGAAESVQLSRTLTDALKGVAQQESATLFMVLLAAFQVLLHRWTGQDDIVLGTAVAGRRKPELEKLIGFFVNTLVLRGNLAGSPTFRDLLQRTRQAALDGFANQDVPFERLVQELRPDRNAKRNPLFQVMFVLQNAPVAAAGMAGLTLEAFDVDNGTAKFDLTLAVAESPHGLRAAFEYNAELFEAATIRRILACFTVLLEGVVDRPDERIGRLPLLPAAERERVVVEFNRTTTDCPRTATIPSLFAEQVRRAPDAVALTYAGLDVSYADLDRRADELARCLRHAGVRPGVLVAVCLERSVELIVALLGVAKAGGAYVSIDPAYPHERLAFMLADSAAPVLIVGEKTRATIAALGDFVPATTTMICLGPEGVDGATSGGTGDDEPPTPTAGDLAYVSYTSGSTGTPKGVCVPHRGVVRLVKATDFAHFGPDEVFLQYAPVAFDASTLEIWGALLNGARLVVAPPGPLTLSELGETIERHGVTTLWLTAGLFAHMIDEQARRLRGVRQLIAGGDVLPVPQVVRALECLPHTRLINGYGPTENTTFTCCHCVTVAPAPGETVPIGRPIANTRVYILDGHGQPVPIGVAGELHAGGDGVASGYWRRPDWTAEKFIEDPFGPEPGARLYRTGDLARWRPDGTIEFLGRLDRQAKIRGYRVEPAEIETLLAAHPAVKDCAVVVRDVAGAKSLVAYVVVRNPPAPPAATWRTFLEAKVPEFLVPAAFVEIDTLPLSANGKVDLAALPPPEPARGASRTDFVAPRGSIERELADIWESVLGVSPIGVHDPFFDLGGHSLLAVRMIAQVEKKFGMRLPVAAVFQHRTISGMARLLRPNGSRYASGSSLVEIQGHGRRRPLYLVHGVGGGMFWGYSNLARHLGAEQPLFAFKSRGLDGLPELRTIEEMAAQYLADLRAQQPHGPYLLGGYCFGGVVAYEMARQLHAQGGKVAMLALMNCSPPNANYERVGNWRSPMWLFKFARNIAYWLGCFAFRWTRRERAEFVRWKLRLLRKKTVGLATQNGGDLAMTDVDEMVNLAAYSEEQRRLWQTHVQALKAYHPQPYEGRVTLFRTRGHALLCSFEPHYGWSELARGGVTLKIMPGGHGSILDEPHVQTVARELERALRETTPAT